MFWRYDMPSGRHAGGRSGGSSRMSSGFSSSRRSSARIGSMRSHGSSMHHGPSHHHWHDPRRFRRYGFWGPTVVVTDGQSSALGLFIMLIFMSIFFGFIMQMGILSIEEDLRVREQEQIYYDNFIANAKSKGKIGEVHVTGYFQSDTGNYWVEYEFGKLSDYSFHNTYLYDGWSYSVYTLQEAMDIYSAGTIDVYHDYNGTTDVNNSNKWDRDTDTIPVSSENKTLMDDSDYVSDLNTRNTMRVIFYVIVGAGILSLVACIAVASKAKKEEEASSSSSSTTTSTTTDNETIMANHESRTHTYCAYCGSKVSKTDTKCPNCGSKTL